MRPLILYFFLITSIHAKVDAYNYDFSTDTLAAFFPGQPLTVIEEKYGKGEIMKTQGERKTLRFWVSQIRYKFPVLVQVEGGNILDMYARLPSYFLHDIFHHSLIKRWGKQDKYKRVDEEAFYEWTQGEHVLSYAASCTITCFPIFFSASLPKNRAPAGFTSQLEELIQHSSQR